MKSIALYGGSFDPIHIGHLITAVNVLNELKVERLIFIPSYKTPLKKEELKSLAVDRYNMVALSIEENNYFDVSDFEIKKEKVSYTYDTIKYFRKKYSNYKIYFIIGTDRVKDLKKWYNIEELKKLVTFVFVSRDNENLDNILQADEFFKNVDYKIIKNEIIEISSTKIRENIKQNKKIDYMIHDKCKKYIEERNLYGIKRDIRES